MNKNPIRLGLFPEDIIMNKLEKGEITNEQAKKQLLELIDKLKKEVKT